MWYAITAVLLFPVCYVVVGQIARRTDTARNWDSTDKGFAVILAGIIAGFWFIVIPVGLVGIILYLAAKPLDRLTDPKVLRRNKGSK